jgi:HEAT repeat protein
MIRLFAPKVEELEKAGNVQELMKLLNHRSTEIRLKAFNALSGKMSNPEVHDKLKSMTNDPDTIVQIAAILKFSDIGEKDILDNIRKVILEGNKNEKLMALRILSQEGSKASPGIVNMVLLAYKDSNMQVRANAIKTMGYLKNEHFVSYLGESLHDRNFRIRMEAIKALGRIGTESTVDHLIGALMDENSEVEKSARNILISLGSPKAMKAIQDKPFLQLLRDMNGPTDKRVETIRHIKDLRKEEGFPLLLKACGDRFKGVRIEALIAVRNFKIDQTIIPVIAKSLEDQYFDVRLEAVRTLAAIPVKESLEALDKALADKSHMVVEEAKQAIELIKSKLG